MHYKWGEQSVMQKATEPHLPRKKAQPTDAIITPLWRQKEWQSFSYVKTTSQHCADDIMALLLRYLSAEQW